MKDSLMNIVVASLMVASVVATAIITVNIFTASPQLVDMHRLDQLEERAHLIARGQGLDIVRERDALNDAIAARDEAEIKRAAAAYETALEREIAKHSARDEILRALYPTAVNPLASAIEERDRLAALPSRTACEDERVRLINIAASQLSPAAFNQLKGDM